MFDEAALIKNIEDSINASIKRASNKMADKLDNALKGTKSDYYDRTGDVVEAFRNPPKAKVDASGNLNWSFIDFDRIISRFNSNTFFNQHMSLDGSTTWRGEKVNELVPIWLNDGFTLPSGAQFEGLWYIQSVLGEDVDEYVYNLLKDALQEYIIAIVQELKRGGV